MILFLNMTEFYDLITGNNDGAAFPLTKPIDASGPLATDGSEFVKEVLDDLWATNQAELDFYNNDPNGLSNDPGVSIFGLPFSQPLAQMYINYQTPGAVVPIFWNPLNTPLSFGAALGFDVRILILQGQGIDRTLPEFELLNALCYVDNDQNETADSFYHADDAAGTIRNDDGDFLILPDMRGQFLRGFDIGGLVDPDGVSRIRPGSSQLDAFQNIIGRFGLSRFQNSAQISGDDSGAFTNLGNIGATSGRVDVGGAVNITRQIIEFDASDSVGARAATESRSVNLSVRWGIYF